MQFELELLLIPTFTLYSLFSLNSIHNFHSYILENQKIKISGIFYYAGQICYCFRRELSLINDQQEIE